MPSIDRQLHELPPLIRVHQHHQLLCQATSLSRASLYRALSNGTLGITPLRINSRMLIRRSELLRTLEIEL